MTEELLEKPKRICNKKNKALPIEIHELLDRYELLFPDNTNLSDLRRAVIDQDLSSIFRLCEQNEANEELRKAVIEENLHSIFRVMEQYPVSGHADDLRRAMLENNLYSLFRLFPEDDETVNLYRTAIVNKNLRSIFKLLGNDDLRKVVIDKNYWKLWPILEKYCDTYFTTAFKSFFVNDTKIDTDCFSRGQLLSKIWLVDELKKLHLPEQLGEHKNTHLGTVFLCAGWYATLSTMLFESGLSIDRLRSFDIDPSVVDIADKFNAPWMADNWKFKAATQDIHDITFPQHFWQAWSNKNNRMSTPVPDWPDTIINTSCEHIEDFRDFLDKIPYGKLVILQSNNYEDIKEHVNTSVSLSRFKLQCNLSTLLYEGELDLGKYKRFMLIGYK